VPIQQAICVRQFAQFPARRAAGTIVEVDKTAIRAAG
jgi:hypothetical protein